MTRENVYNGGHELEPIFLHSMIRTHSQLMLIKLTLSNRLVNRGYE